MVQCYISKTCIQLVILFSASFFSFAEYKDNDGKPWVLPAVSLAEQEIHDEQPIIADYLFPKFYDFPFLSAKLLLGENNPAIKDDRVRSTDYFYHEKSKLISNSNLFTHLDDLQMKLFFLSDIFENQYKGCPR